MNCDECGNEFHPMAKEKPVELFLHSIGRTLRLHEHCWLRLVNKVSEPRIAMRGVRQ